MIQLLLDHFLFVNNINDFGQTIEKGGMKVKKLVIRMITIILLLGCAYATSPVQIKAFSSQNVARGAFGDDVIELQSRLQYIGYYTGTIDGTFGYGTYWALRNFQEKYGLPVDGIAGLKTRKKLVDVSQYDEKFVKDNLNKGNKFTYYGSKPLASQVGKGAGKKENVQLPAKYSDQDLKADGECRLWGGKRRTVRRSSCCRCGHFEPDRASRFSGYSRWCHFPTACIYRGR